MVATAATIQIPGRKIGHLEEVHPAKQLSTAKTREAFAIQRVLTRVPVLHIWVKGFFLLHPNKNVGVPQNGIDQKIYSKITAGTICENQHFNLSKSLLAFTVGKQFGFNSPETRFINSRLRVAATRSQLGC